MTPEKQIMEGTICVGVYDGRGLLIETKDVDLRDLRCIDLLHVAPLSTLVVQETGPRKWFVVQTVVRGEKKMVEGLNDMGFETYLPIMRKEVFRRRSRKLTVREFILINRYVFAELPGDPQQWGMVRAIEEFSGALGSDGRPQPIDEAEVRRFMSAQENLDFDDTKEAKIKRKEIGRNRRQTTAMRYPVGSRLKALSGPFGGFAGQVVSITGKGTIKAMLSLFGGMTLVEFASEAVVPA